MKEIKLDDIDFERKKSNISKDKSFYKMVDYIELNVPEIIDRKSEEGELAWEELTDIVWGIWKTLLI